jgi:hypothetical protein
LDADARGTVQFWPQLLARHASNPLNVENALIRPKGAGERSEAARSFDRLCEPLILEHAFLRHGFAAASVIGSPPDQEPAVSYKVELILDDSDNWVGNEAIRFDTEQEAKDYAADLTMCWTLVRKTRVVESKNFANYHWADGCLIRGTRNGMTEK